MTRHVIVAKVDNVPGVVSRISGLFTRRGYNIESFVTGVTGDESVYQLTISLNGTREEVDLLIRQLGRITEVIDIFRAEPENSITKELLFIKLKGGTGNGLPIEKAIAGLDAKIVSKTESATILQAVGTSSELDRLLVNLRGADVLEIVRSGALAVIT